ncbi:hypothetical protein L195_g022866 [Trifolium pratense]|uniref:Uncharacterized protein n=1 Tax=Trifolium pratense TaxID=57577 RepID=A0A2K3N9C5_TRIPR|nr:hypothetical protein L195_g022866 [Trifolium pratense]
MWDFLTHSICPPPFNHSSTAVHSPSPPFNFDHQSVKPSSVVLFVLCISKGSAATMIQLTPKTTD